MSTFSYGRTPDPTDGSPERVRALLQSMAAEGPTLLGPGLRWNRTERRMEVDPATLPSGGVPQEVIDARTHGGLNATFVSLTARLNVNDVVMWPGSGWTGGTYLTLSTDTLLNGGFLYHFLGPVGTFSAPTTLGTGKVSVLKFVQDAQNVGFQQLNATYFNQAQNNSVTINGTSIPFNSVTGLALVDAFFGGTGWTAPGALYNQTQAQNNAYQLAAVIGYLSALHVALKNKKVIQ